MGQGWTFVRRIWPLRNDCQLRGAQQSPRRRAAGGSVKKYPAGRPSDAIVADENIAAVININPRTSGL